MTIVEEVVDLKTPTGAMRTHIVRPVAAGKYPGIVFYSEIFQITGPIRRTAAMLATVRQQRSAVVGGLHRIEQGTYGVCADCGAGVPEGRLEARPDAARCVACQAKRDRLRR